MERLGRWVSLVALIAGLASITVASAQSGNLGGSISSTQGQANIVHSDGRVEAARSGAPVAAGDRIETGLGGATSVAYNDGSTVALGSNTTIDLQKSEGGPTGNLQVTASQSRGVTIARIPSGKEGEIRIEASAAGATALLRQGGMVVRTDDGTNDVAVACDDTQSRVFFPYEDLRVPCEQRIVRTFTSDGDIVDSGQGSQPSVVAVFEEVHDGKQNGIDPAGQAEQRAQKQNEREENEKEDHDNGTGQNGSAIPSPSPSPGPNPSPFSFTGRCDNSILNGTASCSFTATNFSDARVGGTPTISIQTLRLSGGTVTEQFACTAVSSSFGFTCIFSTSGQVFQGTPVNLTYPLVAGGTKSLDFFINCDFFRPPGVAC